MKGNIINIIKVNAASKAYPVYLPAIEFSFPINQELSLSECSEPVLHSKLGIARKLFAPSLDSG